MNGKRQLFILYYAGHAAAPGRFNNLDITSKISLDKINGSQLNMSLIKDSLKELALTSKGSNVLILLDCCCAAVARRGTISRERVELMAATASGGISNSRQDGKNFTQHWCQAFEELPTVGQPFDCDDIKTTINSIYNLE